MSRDLTFTVVAWRDGRVIADMKVGPKTGWHQVHFHDELGRVGLYYGFKRVAAGQLFLATVFHYKYPSDSTRTRSSAAIVEVQFGEDGAVSRMETDLAGVGSKSDYAEMDVSLNYEPEPVSGTGTCCSVRTETRRSITSRLEMHSVDVELQNWPTVVKR